MTHPTCQTCKNWLDFGKNYTGFGSCVEIPAARDAFDSNGEMRADYSGHTAVDIYGVYYLQTTAKYYCPMHSELPK